MRRIRLIVSYDGTNYCGWQIQENAVTVEGTLTDALRKWLKEDIEIIGAICDWSQSLSAGRYSCAEVR